MDACPTPCALLHPPGYAPAALDSMLREDEPGMYPEQENSHHAETERMQGASLFSLLSQTDSLKSIRIGTTELAE